MATAVQSQMTMPPAFTNQCMDPDTDSFFDFSQLPSPTSTAVSQQTSNPATTITSPANTLLDGEDLQTPAKPSHEYGRFKQQTGLPSGSISGIGPSNNAGFSMYSSTGLDEMSLMGDSSMMGGWNSGIGMDMDMMSSQPAYFYPSNDASQSSDYVDPSAITQEEVQNVRVWPGMHQQQAALARAQAQAQQQRQQQLVQQRQQQAAQQSRQQHSRKSSSPLSDAQTEETIARVVNQIRQQSQNSALAAAESQQNVLPHVIRAKKDEDEMDEDERLLASEQGKKLSSKERRQLRNKVSARAFRSRRKEYIGQLEGEVAIKVQEANELRTQNLALMEENARSRAFIERLLRHQAFTPFLEELSRDEAVQPKPVMSTMSSASTTPTPTPVRKEPSMYANQQFNGMPSQPETRHIGMALIPETPLDMSMLNINGNSWGMNNNSSFTYQQPQVFAVLELPEGPVNPIDTDALSGKGYSSIFSIEDSADEVKPDFPVIERPVESSPAVEVDEEEQDPEFDLYYSSPAPSSSSSTVAAAPLENHDNLFGDASPEKVFAHFELFISDEAADERLMARFERQCARMNTVYERIAALTSYLDS
ncbi:hypothetical protein CC80DRAFT_517376 [Byssothecium circinans]|uniref:BZIP domain-containing protein n=1 Tax=Byssothecium circinans TaxID=147558 RepID=A0A6A5TVQ6_9PLEO|nr:hypothetical protein CC80DRAFT_517376 [Byssothecium circinans]